MAKLGAVQSPGYPFHPANPAENDLPPRRKLILDTIREADAPLQPREIANELHLHLNTIRDHLAALVEAGLLIRKTVPHAGRGRPAIAYMTPPGDADTPDRRTSNALIVMLLDHLDETSPIPEVEARRMGEEMGRYLATTLNSERPLYLELLRLAQDWGFDAAWHSSTNTLTLGSCPLGLEEIIRCNLLSEIHAGVLRGVVEGTGHSLDDCKAVSREDGTSCVQFLPKAFTNVV